MSSYNDFLLVVDSLPKSTSFAVTYDWCSSKGLILTPDLAKSWGRQFAVDYVSHNTLSCGKGSDNHHLYQKI